MKIRSSLTLVYGLPRSPAELYRKGFNVIDSNQLHIPIDLGH